MKYSVIIERPAQRQIEALRGDIRERIDAAILALADNPRPSGVKKLAGYRNYWRIRVGAYRVVYCIQDDIVTVIVLKIAHRREVYR